MLMRKLTIAVLLCAIWPLMTVQAAGLDGTWIDEATYEGKTWQREITFHVSGNTFTGELESDDPGWQNKIHDGRINGNRFSFKTGNNDAIVVTGTFDGDQLHMTWDVTDTPREERYTSIATRKK